MEQAFPHELVIHVNFFLRIFLLAMKEMIYS